MNIPVFLDAAALLAALTSIATELREPESLSKFKLMGLSSNGFGFRYV
ncbi:MAG: hypothetical protein ACJA13_003594 [Paraglaciecola sp.]|jgi:hypothetical protein